MSAMSGRSLRWVMLLPFLALLALTLWKGFTMKIERKEITTESVFEEVHRAGSPAKRIVLTPDF